MLDGKPGSRLFPGPLPTLFAYDARELARWEIPRRLLPPGSEVRIKRPSFWNLYPGRILAVVALCLGQGALIAWLYASRRRAQRAQEELRDVTSRLVAAQEEERARLERELHDDVTQRLARLAIDAGRAETTGADAATLRGLREGLVALSEGVHALSYSLHPSILDDLGLVEAVQAECDRVAEQSAPDRTTSPATGSGAWRGKTPCSTASPSISALQMFLKNWRH